METSGDGLYKLVIPRTDQTAPKDLSYMAIAIVDWTANLNRTE